MSPKEKAEELITKFIPYVEFWDCRNDEPIEEDYAKECALVCAETHLDYCENNSPFPTMAKWIEHNDYWRKVKKEIEKL